MSLKFILPWIAAVGALALAVVLYSGNLRAEAELAQLEERAAGMEQLRAENQRLQEIEASEEELERLRTENRELFRLRNEVGQLRKKHAQPQAASARPPAPPRVPPVARRPSVPLQSAPEEPAQEASDAPTGAEVCVANLVMLDEAKAAWAQDSGIQPGTAVQMQQLIPYLGDDADLECPERGTYTLNPASVPPTCSIPEHKVVYEH